MHSPVSFTTKILFGVAGSRSHFVGKRKAFSAATQGVLNI